MFWRNKKNDDRSIEPRAANINPPPPPPPPRRNFTGGHMGPTGEGNSNPPTSGSSVKNISSDKERELELRVLQRLENRLGLPSLRGTMTILMSDSLGYDASGNNSKLLAEVDSIAIEDGDYVRLDGDQKCPKCGSLYRSHPVVQGALWLRRGCDKLVKL